MKKYLLASKQLNPVTNGKYNYCPICIKRWKDQNQNNPNANYKDSLKPLIYQRHLIIEGIDKQGNEIKSFEETWFCSRCDKSLTTEDFVHFYCVKADGSKYSDSEKGI